MAITHSTGQYAAVWSETEVDGQVSLSTTRRTTSWVEWSGGLRSVMGD